MPITAEQREARRDHLGASDMPAILGVDPWRTAGDVYLSKVHDLADIDGREPIELGNDFEGPLVRWAARELGVEIRENVSIVSGEDPLFAANLDARAADPGVPLGVEAKFSGDGEDWGEEGTDQVPERVIVQGQTQMFCGELEVTWVPVLTVRFGRPKRLLYQVTRNEPLIEIIREEGRRFWEECVLPQMPPIDRLPSIETLKRVRRLEGEVVYVPEELVLEWDEIRQRRLDDKKAEEKALAKVLANLGDAEIGDFGDAARWFTYREQGKTYVPTKVLRNQHPDIYDKLKTETRYRVPRLQKR